MIPSQMAPRRCTSTATLLLFLSATLAAAATAATADGTVRITHTCRHDHYISRQAQAIVLDQSYAAVVPDTANTAAGEGDGPRRRAQALDDGLTTVAAGYQSLRIKSLPVALNASAEGMNAAKVTFINSLAQAVADKWGTLLQVNRVSGPLYASRWCSSSMGASYGLPARCVTFQDTSCGSGSDSVYDDVPIPFPSDYYASQTYYTGSSSGYTTPATTVGGAGVAGGADFAIFITAKHVYGVCPADPSQGGTLAYALTCQRDQYDRPTWGRVNFCPKAIPDVPPAPGTSAYHSLFAVALHEYAHALGFSSSSWPLFRNWDASHSPKTPRDGSYWQQVSSTVDYTCDGYSYTGEDYAATNTVDYFAERGMAKCTLAQAGAASENCVAKLVGPRALAAAREHFACSTLNGAELENQLTTPCTLQGSHWEQRLFNTELMSSYLTAPSLISAVTLAVLEDSGWYSANYSAADGWRAGLDWGYKQGCAFATDKCVNASTGVGTGSPAHFVTDTTKRCTVDRSGYGLASISTGGTVPAQYQYWPSDPTKEGSDYVDYCPVVSPYSNGVCADAMGNANLDLYYGQYWAQTNSVCMESSLLRKGYSGSGPGVGCYVFSCAGSAVGAYTLTITTRNTADYSYGGVTYPQVQTATCTSAEKGQSKTLAGYNGAITCPDVDALCTPAAPLVPSYVTAATSSTNSSSGGTGTAETATPTATSSSSARPSSSASATATKTAAPSSSASATATASQSAAASGSASASGSHSSAPTGSATSTASSSAAASSSSSATATRTAGASSSASSTASRSAAASPTSSATSSASAVASTSAAATSSAIAAATATSSTAADPSQTAAASASPAQASPTANPTSTASLPAVTATSASSTPSSPAVVASQSSLPTPTATGTGTASAEAPAASTTATATASAAVASTAASSSTLPSSSPSSAASSSPSSRPVAVSATLVIRGLSKAEAEAAGTAFRDAIIQGLATLLGIPASRIRIKTIYVAAARALLAAPHVARQGDEVGMATSGAGTLARALGAGDLSVEFSVETTAGTAEAAVTSTITSALPASGSPAAPFASAVTSLVSSVAAATGKTPAALALAVPPSSIVSTPVADQPSPEPAAGLTLGAAIGVAIAAAAAVGAAGLTIRYLQQRAAGRGSGASAANHQRRASTAVAPAPAAAAQQAVAPWRPVGTRQGMTVRAVLAQAGPVGGVPLPHARGAGAGVVRGSTAV